MSVKTDLVTNQKSKDYNQKEPFDGGDKLKQKWNMLIFKMWKSWLKVVVWPLYTLL